MSAGVLSDMTFIRLYFTFNRKENKKSCTSFSFLKENARNEFSCCFLMKGHILKSA